jgi:hypothetical protein
LVTAMDVGATDVLADCEFGARAKLVAFQVYS